VRRRPVLYRGLVPVEDEQDTWPDAVACARIAERAEAEHIAIEAPGRFLVLPRAVDDGLKHARQLRTHADQTKLAKFDHAELSSHLCRRRRGRRRSSRAAPRFRLVRPRTVASFIGLWPSTRARRPANRERPDDAEVMAGGIDGIVDAARLTLN
jgi:hypothetical protein